MKPFIVIVFAALVGLISSCTSDPFLPDSGECPPNLISFETQILPIISSNCAFSGCHDAETAEDGVVLDTYDKIMKEVKPGDPNDSELYESITDEPDDIMPPPPYNPLSQSQIRLIYDWIMQGAHNITCETECDTSIVTFSGVVFPILQNQCVSCHTDNLASGNVNLSTYTHIKSYVDNGSLIGSIEHTGGFSIMPPSGLKMNQCDIDKINIWIEGGALDD